MTRHQPDNHHSGDAALDHVIDAAMSGILAKLEEAFEPEAGLADIHARRTVAAPADPARRPGGTDSSRLGQVCDQIDLLTGWLADLIASGQQRPLSGSSFLELARDNLVQLRAGLAARTMARPEAQRLTTDIGNELAQADQILRSQHATTLDRIASTKPGHDGALADQVEVLREMVTRLYEPDADGVSLQPAR